MDVQDAAIIFMKKIVCHRKLGHRFGLNGDSTGYTVMLKWRKADTSRRTNGSGPF